MADWETAPSPDSGGWETAPVAPKGALGSEEIVRRQAGALGRKASAAMQKVLGTRDEGIDYSGIPDTTAQAAYSIISSPTAKNRYLEDKYGKGNVTKDSYGRDIVIQGGKKIAFVPASDSKNVAAGYGSIAGDVLPVAGMISGGVAGSPGGVIGGAAMSAGGGAAGVALNKLLARTLGLPDDQSSEQAARDIIMQGAVPGAVGEGVGRAAGYLGRTALAPYAPGSALGPWPRNVPRYQEQMADVDQAIGYGMRPRVGTVAPNAPFVQRVQNAAFRLFGDELPSINKPVIEKNVNELVGKASGGVPTGATPADITASLSTRAESVATAAQKAAETARSEAGKLLKQAQDSITSRVGAPSGDLSKMVETDVRAFKDAFNKESKALYAPVDEMIGKPVVPTAGIKDALKSILKENPLVKPSEVFAKSINDLPDYVTFQQMQSIRSTLYSKGDFAALNSGLSDRNAGQLAGAANMAFDAAGKGPFAGSAEATKALRAADQFYKTNIKKFEDLSVEALVKDASKTGYIQPEKVARFIATPGNTDKLLRIKKVVTPSTWKEIGAETWANTVRDSVNAMTGEVDGKLLATKLNTMSKNGMLDQLYGVEAANMRRLSHQMAALDGKAPVDSMLSGDIQTSLENAVRVHKEADSLVKADWIKAMRSDGPESLTAVDYITKPESRLQFRKMRDTFGSTSPEVNSTKEYLARKIFSTMEQPASKGAEKFSSTELMGEPLLKELNRYGKDYLTEVFGKDWTESAFSFAKAAEVATRKNPVDSGGLLAASLGFHPIKNLAQLTRVFLVGEALSSPAAIKYMTKGMMQGDIGQVIREMSMFSTRAASDYAAYESEKGMETASQRVKAKASNLR